RRRLGHRSLGHRGRSWPRLAGSNTGSAAAIARSLLHYALGVSPLLALSERNNLGRQRLGAAAELSPSLHQLAALLEPIGPIIGALDITSDSVVERHLNGFSREVVVICP